MAKKIILISLFTIVVSLGFVFYFKKVFDVKSQALPNPVAFTPIIETKAVKKQEIRLNKYGIPIDSVDETRTKVKRNENLKKILAAYDILPHKIEEVYNKVKEEIPAFKKVKPGKKYTVFHSRGCESAAECFVYEVSPSSDIVVKLKDSVVVYTMQKQVDTVMQSKGGTIYGSLYESLDLLNAPPDLATDLSKIFSHKVDFFRFKKGDNFKVIYEEITSNGKPSEVLRVHSAVIEQRGQKFYAFNLGKKGKNDFYDENGSSFKQKNGFLKAPLKYFRITSKFSLNRFHPVQRVFKAHLGTDYAAPSGTPILSVAKGKVIAAGYSACNGYFVKVQHDKTIATQYLHMSKIKKGVKPGLKVKQGDVIGYVGSTGLATGPHLCFRFWYNGKQVDPNKVKVKKVTEELTGKGLKDFKRVKTEFIENLSKINLENPADIVGGS